MSQRDIPRRDESPLETVAEFNHDARADKDALICCSPCPARAQSE